MTIETPTKPPIPTIEVAPGSEQAFEAALSESEPRGETLWYRMIAGGNAPRYVRLRPRANLSSLLAEPREQGSDLSVRTTVEILTLRPAMCYGVEVPQ